MASMSFSSSSSSSSLGWTYDVFLSFRGKDTRKNFIDHLYTALVKAGIHTFLDDTELPRGEDILQILNAIQRSKISIIVFSKGYASSTWCLDELVMVMECRRVIGQIILPIFYDIDPSHVQEQTGIFAEAFKIHEKRFKEEIEMVNRWKGALVEASNLSGWDLQNMANGYESKFIQMIVEDVYYKLDRKYLNVAKHPIGIGSRVRRLLHLLSTDTNDNVHIVGIHGMGGLGKTTIAKAVFNELCDGFEGSCFLLNVKDISKQPNGWVRLQEQLLYDILGPHNLKIINIDRGIQLIKERLCKKRVLVIIDDVDELEQLDRLIEERSWVGSGSIIIVTTRDEHILTQFGVDGKYKIEILDEDESLQLLSRYAFMDTHPGEDYVALSNEMVHYCGGLPLALKVLGSHLCKRSKPEWEGEIKKLQNSPDDRIQKILKTSFVALDGYTKGIFLDIACFFIGWNKDYTMTILDGRGFIPERGIAILIQTSLLTIDDEEGTLNMHDLIRDMGREIVRETTSNHLGEHSRIWRHMDAWNVLEKQMGTDRVEGLMLDIPRESEVESLSTKSFKKMRYLKLLQINGLHLTGGYGYLSKELIWLCWHQCPLKSLPSDLEINNLSVLDMQHSNIKKLWKGIKVLNKLKILNLSYSKHLTVSPKIRSSSLEKLILKGCSSLIELHPSIKYLDRLVVLNLKGCCRLKDLPESMCYLRYLETLDINQCLELERVPEQLGDLESLTELLADGTAIKQLPSSIGNLKNLKILSLYNCNYNQDSPSTSWLSMISSWFSPRCSNPSAFLPPSFAGISSLETLDLSYCGLSEDAISRTDFGGLVGLKRLSLDGNKFFNLPSGISFLPKLSKLSVQNCGNLLSISELPSCLHYLYARDCTSLERISFSPSKWIYLFMCELNDCKKLTEIQGNFSGRIQMNNCTSLADNCAKTVLQGLRDDQFSYAFLPGDEVPDWFSHHGDEYSSKLSLHVPVGVHKLLVWVVFEIKESQLVRHIKAQLTVRNKSRTHSWTRITGFTTKNLSTNHSWLTSIDYLLSDCNRRIRLEPYLCLQEGGEEFELSVTVKDNDPVGNCFEELNSAVRPKGVGAHPMECFEP